MIRAQKSRVVAKLPFRESRHGLFCGAPRKPGDSSIVRIATILIEPNSLFREGLSHILAETRFQVIASASTSDDLGQNALPDSPGLLLFGTGDDPALIARDIERCKNQFPASRCVLLTDQFDRDKLLAVLRIGVDACLSKRISTEALIKAFDLVMLGEMVFSTVILPVIRDCADLWSEGSTVPEPQPVGKQELDHGSHRLSAREVDALYCLIQGNSNKLIARKFAIAEATVKVHIKAILRKIRVANRTQAAIWAMNNLPPPIHVATQPEAEELPMINGAGGLHYSE